jgi:hypothetical protein
MVMHLFLSVGDGIHFLESIIVDEASVASNMPEDSSSATELRTSSVGILSQASHEISSIDGTIFAFITKVKIFGRGGIAIRVDDLGPMITIVGEVIFFYKVVT